MADEGFFSRWSKRKAQVRAGTPVVEPEQAPAPQAAPQSPVQPSVQHSVQPRPLAPEGGRGAQPASPATQPPPPTLEDVRSLTFDSDFKRFVAPEVAPEVKNAAVKKLFADPRFNVRDMMDVYADDYSRPDPLPDTMLRELASARFLKLFEDKSGTAENADDEGARTVAQSAWAPEAVPPEPPNADADLRLQQDDAPAGESAGDGIERGAAAAHEPVPARNGELPESGAG